MKRILLLAAVLACCTASAQDFLGGASPVEKFDVDAVQFTREKP